MRQRSAAARKGQSKGSASAARKRALGPRPADPVTAERAYSDDELEWLRALEAFRVKRGVRFMNGCDYLHVAKSIGYAKVQP